MLLLRANTLALGPLGLPAAARRPDLRAPRRAGSTRSCRSRGASGRPGDLAPLAHLALPLIGRGEVEVDGRRSCRRASALRERGPGAADARAQGGPRAAQRHPADVARSARCSLADADRLARTASVAAAMSVEALLGTEVAFAAPYQLARPHPGQVAVAGELRHLLRGSGLQQAHHGSAHKVQDPYSLRCVPQVHGAVRDALDHLRRVLDIELNSATDNPLVFPAGGVGPDRRARDGRRAGDQRRQLPRRADRARARLREARAGRARLDLRAADGAARSTPASTAACRRSCRPDPGRNSGLMIVQYTAAALASENKVLAHPSSADSIPTSREPGGPRLDGRHGRAARADGPRARRADRRRSSCSCAAQALDLRLALLAAEAPVRPLPGDGVAEAHAPGPRARSGRSPATASRARTSPRRSRSSTTARSSTSPDRRRAVTVDSPPWPIRIVDVTDEASFAPAAAVRGSRVRPPVVRLLGGRRSRLEGRSRLVARAVARRRTPPAAAAAAANPFAPDDDDEPAFNPFAAASKRPTFNPFADDDERADRQPVRAAARAAPRRLRRTRRASCGCSAAASPSSGATRRSCSTTTSPPPTRSSDRCPRTRARCGPASSTRGCRTRRCRR